MKNVIASTTLLITALIASAAARADCTSSPVRLGTQVARQACEDLAEGYLPLSRVPPAEPLDTTCKRSDIFRCKNAMAQYLRSRAGRPCDKLLRQDGPLAHAPGVTAAEAWRTHVVPACNPSSN